MAPLSRAVAVAVVLLAAACSKPAATTSAVPPEQAKQLLLNRNWIDRLPERVDDKLKVYRFVPSMGGGVFQDRTLFKGTFELFTFGVDGDHIDFNMPETHERVRRRLAARANEQRAGDGDRSDGAHQPRSTGMLYFLTRRWM